MKRKINILVVVASLVAVTIIGLDIWQSRDQGVKMIVYKSPTCGCCVKWVEHMEANGFEVISRNRTDMRSVKETYDVPARGYSCHTAIVEGYTIEGHVPAEFVLRLLKERPAVKGLAVPGMPIGSPGMEGPNPQPYSVLSFDESGDLSEYAAVDP